MPRVSNHRRDNVDEWFWSQAERNPETGCLLWTGVKVRRGYGAVYFEGRIRIASNLAWELAFGTPLPKGYQAAHNCPGGDNTACIEPKHLFAATGSENMKDYHAKRRALGLTWHGSQYKETPRVRIRPAGVFGKCAFGHLLSASTTVTNPETGVHHCKACRDTSIRFTRETPALYSVGAA